MIIEYTNGASIKVDAVNSAIIADLPCYAALVSEADAIDRASSVIDDIAGYSAGIIESDAIANGAVIRDVTCLSDRAWVIEYTDGTSIEVDAINGSLIGNVTFYRAII